MISLQNLSLSLPTVIGAAFLWELKQDLATSKYQNSQDTDIKVYGPYRAVKLPINKGVKIGNQSKLPSVQKVCYMR